MSDARSSLAALVEAFDRNRGKGLAFAHAIDDGIEQARTFLAAAPATLPADYTCPGCGHHTYFRLTSLPIDVERLARALLATRDNVNYPKRWEQEDFEWLARQVATAYAYAFATDLAARYAAEGEGA